MRRIVATLTALAVGVLAWVGSPNVAPAQEIPNPQAWRCSTPAACYKSTLYNLGIDERDARTLGSQRLTIATVGGPRTINYRRGQSLHALVASGGRSGGHTAYAAHKRSHATRLAGHHPRHRAAPAAARTAAAVPPAPIAAVPAVERPTVSTTTVASVDEVARLKRAVAEANEKVAQLQTRVQEVEAAASAATAKADAIESRATALERDVEELKAAPARAPIGFETLRGQVTPAFFWTLIALTTLFALTALALALLAAALIRLRHSVIRNGLLEPVAGEDAGDIPLHHTVGQRIIFPVKDGYLPNGRTLEVPVTVTAEPVPDYRNLRGRGRKLCLTILGHPEWEYALPAQERGNPIAVGYLDDEGRFVPTLQTLTERIWEAERQPSNKRAALTRDWLQHHNWWPLQLRQNEPIFDHRSVYIDRGQYRLAA